MRIIHLSDPHFGTHETNVLNALNQKISDLAPDMTIISGDFTQKASHKEFQQAQDFLENLPCPCLAVPGNHDISPVNLWERFFNPYKKYTKYIHHNLCPSYENDQVKILGINSARRILPHWNWANGAISRHQRQLLLKSFHKLEDNWNILTLHHPIHKMVGESPIGVKLFGSKKAYNLILNLHLDVVLTGHVHHASVHSIKNSVGRDTLFVSASTALSSRIRDHDNGFNSLDFEGNQLTINRYNLVGKEFEITHQSQHYK